jgi:hypothetical protein
MQEPTGFSRNRNGKKYKNNIVWACGCHGHVQMPGRVARHASHLARLSKRICLACQRKREDALEALDEIEYEINLDAGMGKWEAWPKNPKSNKWRFPELKRLAETKNWSLSRLEAAGLVPYDTPWINK